MRGIMFTEYFDFAISLAGEHILDEVLNDLGGSITGAYTSVGNYSFSEFAKIHTLVCEKLDASPDDTARQFGEVLLSRFKDLFLAYFTGVESGITFLETVGAHIHEEVKKLYPDAKPPEIYIEWQNEVPAFLVYQSHRPLAAVAEGLASACLKDFGDPFRLGSGFKVEDRVKFPLEPVSG